MFDVQSGDTGHQAIRVDVGSSASVNAMFETIKGSYKQPATIVVNCAAIGSSGCPLVSVDEDDLDKLMRTNLKGTYLVTRAAARAMIAGKGTDCAIVNVASVVAKQICPGLSAYSACKAGVVALTQVAAKELAVHGVRVNVVLPGLVDTPMAHEAFGAEPLARFVADHPMRRLCRPEEVAQTVKFLCGPDSSYTSGVTVDVMIAI